MNQTDDNKAAEGGSSPLICSRESDTPETDRIFGGLSATDAGYWRAVSMCRDLERQRNETRDVLRVLADAVGSARVPQNGVDAAMQIFVTLGPALESARKVLSENTEAWQPATEKHYGN